jgi:hexosaminidase
MTNKLPVTLFKTVASVAALAFLVGCGNDNPAKLSEQGLIPMPVSVTASDSVFELTDNTAIYVPQNSEEARKIGQYLADKLNPSTGLGLEVKTTDGAPVAGNIYLSLTDADTTLSDEGYELTITTQGVNLTAHQPAGLFRGIQTLRQALPAAIEKTDKQSGSWKIPTGTIRDYPTYAYRGAMLDVARHFFSVEDVKRYIDLISAYKMNVLHLHLSDDQGWRIEIKSWPKLTSEGSKSEVGGGEGGFYTQEQYKDIVKYAQDRYITIVPEIDMPGHTNAALAAYPELNCNEKDPNPKPYTGIEVGFSTLCTSNEITYKFVDDVVRELSAITPGPYFHMGGDESHVTAMEDYIPFVNRVQDIVQSHGKQMIGWDEVTNASLKPTSVAQYWAKAEYAQSAAKQGAKVIMSPAKYAYLDMQYDSTSKYGLHWAAYIELDSAYNWEPSTMVPGVTQANILGVEAPIWTETIENMEALEYMAFPRLPGLAEIGWSPKSVRNWEGYRARLAKNGKRMEAMGIDYYPSKQIDWIK